MSAGYGRPVRGTHSGARCGAARCTPPRGHDRRRPCCPRSTRSATASPNLVAMRSCHVPLSPPRALSRNPWLNMTCAPGRSTSHVTDCEGLLKGNRTTGRSREEVSPVYEIESSVSREHELYAPRVDALFAKPGKLCLRYGLSS